MAAACSGVREIGGSCADCWEAGEDEDASVAASTSSAKAGSITCSRNAIRVRIGKKDASNVLCSNR